MTDSPERNSLRERVLEATLPHVPFDGWTLAALASGAVDAGLAPETALRAFPRGAVEAVEFWCTRADRRMMEALAARDLGLLKTRERVALGVRLRLAALEHHREALRRALGLFALPLHAGAAGLSLWRTVDAIWYAAGDRATDFNFYTKRALLAGVYGATLLYWLDDRSEGAAETWAFLDRRIADAMSVPRKLAALGQRLSALPGPWRWFRA